MGSAKTNRSAFKAPNRLRSVLAFRIRDRAGRLSSQVVMSSWVTCRNFEYLSPTSVRNDRMLEMPVTIVRRSRGSRRGLPWRSRSSQTSSSVRI